MQLERSVDLLVTGGVVVTVDSDRRILGDGAIAIDNGRIVAVGSSGEFDRRFGNAATVIDADGGVITPGFVDAHVHLSQHLGRSCLPDTWPEHREHDQWLPYWLNISEEDAELSATLACIEMLQSGTTTFCDMTGRFDAEIQARVAEQTGIRGMVSETVWDLPPHESVGTGSTGACVSRLDSLLDRFPFREDGLVWAGVGLAGMGSASDALLAEGKRLADARGVVLYMHQSWGTEDTRLFRERAGGLSAVQHLNALGALGANVNLVHMVHNSDDEIRLLVETGTSLTHCPAASLRWGMGVSRTGLVGRAARWGATIALGSDSGNYSDYLDIGKQMYLAATIHREASGEVPSVTAECALEMATINGARALGVEHWTGSLAVGKQADLVIHSARRAALHPLYDPVRSLVYSSQSSAVDTVIVRGEVVLREGRCTRVDQDAVFDRVDRAARSLSHRMGWRTPHDWPITDVQRLAGR